jgi:hypothetical protein
MYKIVILFSLFTTFVFSATSQQVDQYMSTTHSDRSLIAIEEMFSNLSETVNLSDDNISEQITLAYQIYLGKHISENEMEELLALYRKPIMQQYINEMDMIEIPKEEMENFLLTLKEEPLSTERQDIVDELLKSIINEELLLNFYDSMMQRYTIKKDDNKTKEKDTNSSKKVPTKQEQKFLDIMKKGIEQELLYGTQVLSLEEMKKVNEVIKSSVITKARRVENEAIINIMNGFIQRIISEPKKVEKQ